MSTSCNGADLIAKILKSRGVEQVFALCGGHIMPIWMALDTAGIEIIDVRDERSAVYMAHASSVVDGTLGVALVTAGPGVTNAMTGIANAHKSRIPVLVLSGLPPRPQENRGALQDMSHIDMLRSITRYARTISHVHAIGRELDAAIAAAHGHGGEPGPAFVDLPVDIQREAVPAPLSAGEHVNGNQRPPTRPTTDTLEAAVRLLSKAQRPVVISGRGALPAATELATFLDTAGVGYLDTGESKGLVPEPHAAHIGAVRGAALQQADLIITVGRKLDFQLAYGSPAVFDSAKFLRISDVAAELSDNRLGEVALLGDVATTLTELTQRLGGLIPALDTAWLDGLRETHRERVGRLLESLESAAPDSDGRMAPNRLLAELKKRLDPEGVVIADGGDALAFARIALNARTYLDPGPLGCIGIGTPFAIGAAKAAPGRQVVAVTGDGSFGFTAMEIDTAVRHGAACMIVISNNGSWAIEVRDQMQSFGKVVGTRLQFADYAGMARAFGMKAWRIECEKDIGPALDEAFAALANGEPVLIDAITSPEPPSSDSKSGLAWVPDYQALEAWDKAERDWLGLAKT